MTTSKQFNFNNLSIPPISNLSAEQWEQIVNALMFFIRVQTEELQRHNVGDREWQEIEDYKRTLNDIQFYVLPQINN
jgi:hypothetical protein